VVPRTSIDLENLIGRTIVLGGLAVVEDRQKVGADPARGALDKVVDLDEIVAEAHQGVHGADLEGRHGELDVLCETGTGAGLLVDHLEGTLGRGHWRCGDEPELGGHGDFELLACLLRERDRE